MNLQAVKQINIDFYTQKYININVKQYDRNSRFILVTCYNNGGLMPINNNNCFAYVRYRKSDDYGIFNSCEITKEGKILIELTEQMLATIGMSYVDLVIHEAIGLDVDVLEDDNGDIELNNIGENSILSTMTFCVNVHEATIDNKQIESSYEYDALNDLLIEGRRDYQNVIKACRTSERNAKTSEEKALVSEQNSHENYLLSKSYAVGNAGVRANENEDNSLYYYEGCKLLFESLENGFVLRKTITFEELATAEKATGFAYNISNDFVTDETFREGAGKMYTAGTTVYCCANDMWDCLGGSSHPIATVDEIMEYLQITL